TRKWGPPFREDGGAYYLSATRSKKSVTIDSKSSAGIDRIKKVIQTADAIIHNFTTGPMEKFGLCYESVQKMNEKIIYCSITGFGETGPYRNMPGYDFLVQAMSGLMSITGNEASGPQKMGVAIVDVLTGLYANIGIQAALLERGKS